MSSATARPGDLALPPDIGAPGLFRTFVHALPARQQPEWDDPERLATVTSLLGSVRPLVDLTETDALRNLLGRVARGELGVLQAGDCAEDPAECAPGPVARRAALIDVLAAVMSMHADRPVVRVGRIAGQFAKPRSQPVEKVGGRELPVFRGHMVNDPAPDPEARRAVPERLVLGYRAAAAAAHALRDRRNPNDPVPGSPIWTSHEALLLDYELPMTRQEPDGRLLLTSTHWPWIGERTRQVDGAHVALLASVVNPIACKVGPTVAPDELLELCEHLDPDREPGRLTLISRMGAGRVREALPPLVARVREAGHPVVWLCDPMHGNTTSTPSGAKTRLMDAVLDEVTLFPELVHDAGGVPGGLHLEATPDAVTECVADASRLDETVGRYRSYCDPRLNPDQAIAVAGAWRIPGSRR